MTPLLLILIACAKSPTLEAAPAVAAATEPTASQAAAWVEQTEADLLALWRTQELAHWDHETDLTEAKEARAAQADEATMAFLSTAIPEAARLRQAEGLDPVVARKLDLIGRAATLPAPADEAGRKELAEITTRLSSMYGKGKVCEDPEVPETCRDLGDLEEILSTSDDPATQLEAWEAWRTISPPMRAPYSRFVELANQGAREIGHTDVGAMWRSGYDMPPAQLEAEVDRLWGQLSPLYEQLHCYVRAELSEKYGPEVVPPQGKIPAHLLGNMWAQDWAYLYPLVEPYPGHASLNVDKALVEQGWDERRMVKTAESFFTSVGLDPLPESFWERSMFTKPEDKEVVCHASAWDPSWSDDLRIKMCIRPTMEDLVTIHHELGHDYYFHYYVDQPPLFRSGANDGFHEAIGDAIALSITPGYLKELGLIDEAQTDEKAVINEQLHTALSNVAFLPFGLLVDRWRWEVFSGEIPPEAYNEGWWRLRGELQGVAPPSERTEDLFDPGAKYHIPANTPYLRYFLAQVLQFQLHAAMCEASGSEEPLHTCSVYGSKEAGAKLRAVLEMGAAAPWPDALEAGTGTRELNATPMLTYFDPLMGWLKEQNADRTCGW